MHGIGFLFALDKITYPRDMFELARYRFALTRDRFFLHEIGLLLHGIGLAAIRRKSATQTLARWIPSALSALTRERGSNLQFKL